MTDGVAREPDHRHVMASRTQVKKELEKRNLQPALQWVEVRPLSGCS
jgi:hypothetical protein